MPKQIEVPDNAEEVIIRLKKSTAPAKQGRAKPKPRPKPKGMSKRDRDKTIRNWLIMWLIAWELVARYNGGWGVISWAVNLIMMKFGYTLTI